MKRGSSDRPRWAGSGPRQARLYFYSRGGVFQPAALLSFVVLVKDWETTDYLAFTDIRSEFEAFLLANRNITEAVRKLGTGNRSRPRIIGLYRTIISRLRESKPPAEVTAELRETTEYGFLIDDAEEVVPMLALEGGSFTRETKGAAFIADALPGAPKCPTCGGFMHRNGMQVGHRSHRRDGGSGDASNAQMQHPFCNSTARN